MHIFYKRAKNASKMLQKCFKAKTLTYTVVAIKSIKLNILFKEKK